MLSVEKLSTAVVIIDQRSCKQMIHGYPRKWVPTATSYEGALSLTLQKLPYNVIIKAFLQYTYWFRYDIIKPAKMYYSHVFQLSIFKSYLIAGEPVAYCFNILCFWVFKQLLRVLRIPLPKKWYWGVKGYFIWFKRHLRRYLVIYIFGISEFFSVLWCI
jgi:hypothetical protein